MLGRAPLVTFLATRHPEEARAFYEGVLGLRFVEETPFAVVFDSAGITLRIQKVEDLSPAPYTALGWQVEDIAAAVDELAGRGVDFVRYGFLEQDERGVWTAPDGARVAWMKDPDGNLLSLSQH
jgi:catechol 2,3-dioxygenase-like lactoylglutathione lyase family enzyme